MAKFRKKPVVIEATEFKGEGQFADYPKWLEKAIENGAVKPFKNRVLVHTLEGSMEGGVGDMIIQGVHGELYPCKGGIFKQTYEKAE